jgi:hypothetical protein
MTTEGVSDIGGFGLRKVPFLSLDGKRSMRILLGDERT